MGVLAFALPVVCGSADLSGVPLSSKRVYGRVINRTFSLTSARLKMLGQVTSRNSEGALTDSAQVWALCLDGAGGEGFVLYFTADLGDDLRYLAYRRPPLLRSTPEFRQNMQMAGERKRSVPIGITSAQMLFFNSKNGRVESKVFRDLFSARLLLQAGKSDLMGQILLVLPDQKRSFVYGAFKVAKERSPSVVH